MDYRNVTFRQERVRLDHGRFEACRFEDVLLEYGGGPVHISGCSFEGGLRWAFTGDLGRGLAALGALYADKQAVGLKVLVDAMFPKGEGGEALP